MKVKLIFPRVTFIFKLFHSDSESDHEDEDEEDVDTGNQEDHINQN